MSEQSYTTGPVYIPPQAGPARRLPEEREDPRRAGYNRERYEASPPGAGRGYPPRPGQDRYDRPYEENYEDDRRRRRPVAREREGAGSRWERPPPPRRAGGSRSRSRSPPARTNDPRISSPPVKTQTIPTFMSNTTAPPQAPPPITRPIETFQSRATPVAPVVPKTMGSVTAAGNGGLESFDLSTFDTTSSVHWMSLGAAFKITHGKDASQEELVSTFMAMKNGFPLPSFGGPVAGANNVASNNAGMRNTWQQPYAPSQPAYPSAPAHRINAWETREDDERRRGNRQVGHGSYDGAGTGHALHSGRWQSDAVVLAGDDD